MNKTLFVVLGNMLNRHQLRDQKKLSSKEVILSDKANLLVGEKIVLCVNEEHCKINDIDVAEFVASMKMNNNTVLNTVNMF